MCVGAYTSHHDDMCPPSPRRILQKQREQTACLRRPGIAALKIPPPLQMNNVHLIRDDNSSAHYLRRKYASAENMYGLRRQTTWTTLSSRLCSRFGTVRDFVAKSQKSTRFCGNPVIGHLPLSTHVCVHLGPYHLQLCRIEL